MVSNSRFVRRALLGLLSSVLSVVATAATPTENVRDGKEPAPDADGVIPQKIVHRTAPPIGVTINPFGKTPPSASMGYQPPAGGTSSNAYPIQYYGGPVMASISKVVLIWYGNWNQSNRTDTPTGQQIIRNAIYGLGYDAGMQNSYGSYADYSGVTTGANGIGGFGQYTQSVAGGVTRVASTTILECTQPTSLTYGGRTLSDSAVQSLVKAAAKSSCSGGTPDANAVYLVLSSSDIRESSGFLTKYCGWHTYTTMSTPSGNAAIKYGFIGNPSKSIGSCTYQTTSSPNNNPGVDAMVSVIAHELDETVTDPELNAWYNALGSENGDMCAWTFGSSQALLSNGSYYNVTLPVPTTPVVPGNYSGQYLIQRALGVNNSACYVNANPIIQ
ncbi:hypothetical protein CupriaWKF_22195 [Cupriavidus sp. WKF15]|uniref:hypothetical protein n=1 Tax=Cupriavidus sp. WKF15 TaxID=3032282 RepID=UPI0023E2A1F6|nr:hypothetical protein [Cupriavidus sp. WKF15]WER49837.1 hypothetical protein CupriaWKF_22195 [Cupriavidus sp. WKF15]